MNDNENQKMLENIGKDMAILLHNSNLPDDVKQAWSVVIPHMSAEQIDRLSKLLAQRIKN